MKKTIFIIACFLVALNIDAQTTIPVHPKPGTIHTGGPHKAPLLYPTVTIEEGVLSVSYPCTTVMTVSVCKDDDTFYVEQTFYAVSTASIGDLESGTYTLTVTIGGIVYEGEFEVEEE